MKKPKQICGIRFFDRTLSYLFDATTPCGAYMSQLCFRWTLQLRASEFNLDGFNELYFLVEFRDGLENNSSSSDFNITNVRKVYDFYRQVEIQLRPLSPDLQQSTPVINRLIFCGLQTAGNLDELNEEKLEIAFQKVEKFGTSLIIPIIEVKQKNVEAIISLCPSGEFSMGGKTFLQLTNTSTGTCIQRHLFDYTDYSFVRYLLGKVSISRSEVKILARKAWKETFPQIGEKIVISIAKFFQGDGDFYVNDVTDIVTRISTKRSMFRNDLYDR